MKLNLTKLQYLQLAKEAFTNLINSVPFVSDIEITDPSLGNNTSNVRK